MPRRPRQKIRKLSTPVYKHAIPQIEGPKLAKFLHHRAPIKFRRLLSDSEVDGHAYVFEVQIRSKTYALKWYGYLFKFFDGEEEDAGLSEIEKDRFSLDIIHAHADPFYNECRAYGKLEEVGLNGIVAVRCHGYTTLPPTMESELEERFNVTDWDRDLDEYDKPVKKRAVFRAIVKDMVRGDRPLTHRIFKRMLKDLHKIRRQGVYPSDIKKRNYLQGLLVDFSNAITEPNYLFDLHSAYQIETYKFADLYQFDDMIEQENSKTWLKAMPDKIPLERLRPRKKR